MGSAWWPRLCPSAGLVVLLCSTAWALPVTECGTRIPDRQRGVLQNDLHCSSVHGAIVLGSGSRLYLDGHTITSTAPTRGAAIVAELGCRIEGPGAIVGASLGVHADGHLWIRNVDFQDVNAVVVAEKPGEYGCPPTVTLTNVNATGTGRGTALRAVGVIARHVALRGFHTGIDVASSAQLRDVRVLESADVGISATFLVGARVSVTGSGRLGVFTSLAWLRASSLTGNGRPGEVAEGDILAFRAPRLYRTSCERSWRDPSDPYVTPTESLHACRDDPAPTRPQVAGRPRWVDRFHVLGRPRNVCR